MYLPPPKFAILTFPISNTSVPLTVCAITELLKRAVPLTSSKYVSSDTVPNSKRPADVNLLVCVEPTNVRLKPPCVNVLLPVSVPSTVYILSPKLCQLVPL